MTKPWKYLIGIILLVLILVWLAVFSLPDGKFHLIACNVGEGDSTLLVKGNTQILIDGGPNDKVLSCLSRYMPFWDREIELVILTHPQEDHMLGLTSVFKRFAVDNFMENGSSGSSQVYRVLESQVGGSHSKVLIPTKGQTIRSGQIYLDILNAEKNEKDANKMSLVIKITFGNFTALVTGDVDSKTLEGILREENIKKIAYLRVPHHGSKNGLSHEVIKILEPKLAVISVGKNSYGHPSQETLDMLKENTIKTIRTDEGGDVEAVSDGKRWWVTNY
jgi:competence protein ComEC